MSKRFGRFWVCLAVLLALNHKALAASPDNTLLYFHIHAQPLVHAMAEFARQSGLGLVLDPSVNGQLRTQAVQGTLTPIQALTQMLAGTPLHVRSERGFLVVHPPVQSGESPTPIPVRQMEEVLVTGSLLPQRSDRPLGALAVLERVDLEQSGNPNAVDLIARLPFVAGSQNQSNQYDNQVAEGSANLNLRGLGASRTLVLLNGRRSVRTASSLNDGQAFVDWNTLPLMALERIEVLKDGAAATYGSDAVAGVVNLVTRTDVEGVELGGQGKALAGSDGDWRLSALWGNQGERHQLLAAVEFSQRSELPNAARYSVVRPRLDLPSLGLPLYGQSTLGNPGAFIPVDASAAAGGVTEQEAATAAGGGGAYVADPDCAAAGGIPVSRNRCGLAYVAYANLVDAEDKHTGYLQGQWDLDGDWQLYTELLTSRLAVQHWKTSPSYPPLLEADPNHYLPASHPGLQHFLVTNPTPLRVDGTPADFSGGALFLGRALGAGAPPGEGERQRRTYRGLLALSGALDNGLQLDTTLLYARSRDQARVDDLLTERWRLALLGLGGPGCQGSIPGQRGCLYFNPFASALPASPSFQPSLANDPVLLDWLIAPRLETNVASLSLAEVQLRGTLPLGGQAEVIDYALGSQYRRETLALRFNDLANIDLNPGFGPSAPGLFIFFRGGREEDVQQDVAALFGELRWSADPDWQVQLAARYENYGGHIGYSLDPKLALRWQVKERLALGASFSTTFRAPSLNQNSTDASAVELIGAEFGFKSIDRAGNARLAPERGRNATLSLDWQASDQARVRADLWQLWLRDPVVQQSANSIVNEALANPASPLAANLIFDAGGNIARIVTPYINGPALRLSGLDLGLAYRWPGVGGQWQASLDTAYLHHFDVASSDLHPGYAAAGSLNAGNTWPSLPRVQSVAQLQYLHSRHSLRLTAHYTSHYRDDGLEVLRGTAFEHLITERKVSAFTRWDLHYQWAYSPDSNFNLSILNLADSDPPQVRDDLRFDVSQHDAFGRMLQVGITVQL